MDLPHAGVLLAVVLLDPSVAVVDMEHGQHGVATIAIHEVHVGCSDDRALTATIVRALDLPHDLPTNSFNHSVWTIYFEQGSSQDHHNQEKRICGRLQALTPQISKSKFLHSCCSRMALAGWESWAPIKPPDVSDNLEALEPFLPWLEERRRPDPSLDEA